MTEPTEPTLTPPPTSEAPPSGVEVEAPEFSTILATWLAVIGNLKLHGGDLKRMNQVYSEMKTIHQIFKEAEEEEGQEAGVVDAVAEAPQGEGA